ncbi:carbamate kinase [Chelativorans sp. Marseille-P2723]|uniref:carbamate kinase n=1 Tax=Chelativorans sp. Marseille-P2723 TaxID=2709133 RepID=UPI00156F7E5C|nr:carbamate kinase [Chelativorans sp. Marseille-P2723]
MRVVVALGGNALLKRGEPMTAEVQRANVRKAAEALASLAREHDIIVAHGNGPQVGLLALQAAAYKAVAPYPLDILGAESVGMIGYLVEQELTNALPAATRLATLLTQIEVDRDDPAFGRPEKPIGPVYDDVEAEKARTAHGWALVEEAQGKWRRVVPSPLPKRIIQIETLRLLVDLGVVVVCAGGGGIPVIRDEQNDLMGVEAVIDKDRAAGLLAEELSVDAFLMLTDVDAVYADWGTPQQRAIDHVRPDQIDPADFPAGSMGPKVEAARAFASRPGRIAGIGRLEDAAAILEGRAGTLVSATANPPARGV